MESTEHTDVLIIGAGQSGLALGYQLQQRGRQVLLVDRNDRIGDSWRGRWDSLKLYSPASRDALPGLPFPAGRTAYPTKDEMADYLEAYAGRFDLPVRTSTRVDGLVRDGDRYVISSGSHRFEADNVVVASGACQIPRVPPFAPELDPAIVQMHSSDYRHPSQLPEGDVLLVGVGNSGAEIAFEVCRTHTTWLSGKPSGEIPVRHGATAARFVLPIVRFLGHHVLTMGNPIGRRMIPKLATEGAPLIRVKLKDLAAAGVEQVPRTVGVKDGLPEFADGRVQDVASVIWCTGFHYGFSWIDLPVFGDGGAPIHERGVVLTQPGLYFMGLEFQYAATSDVLPGVGRDAGYIAKHIASRTQNVPARDAAPSERR